MGKRAARRRRFKAPHVPTESKVVDIPSHVVEAWRKDVHIEPFPEVDIEALPTAD